jgi:2',3'-cyclic-nucleotide 2'-phosphodiesterase/3'-nucleotidase
MVRFVDGKILQAQSFTVVAGRPDTPSLLNQITNTDKVVKVVAAKDCKITLTIGKKTYTTKKYQYDKATDQYIYTLKTDRDLSGTKVTVTASNESGTSDPLVSKLVKVAPDSPKVNPILAGDKVITGTIELLDYVDPQKDNSKKEEKLPKEFKNAPSKVAKTQTRVYAQIGKKTYEGTIDNKGKFVIEIPKQKKGTAIKIWGTNKAGRGPLVKVLVTKK